MTHPRRQPRPGTAHRGFTLVELMIAVAVVGILVAIALPSYQSSVLKAHRIDGKTALLDLASREERYFGVYNQYTNVATNLGYAAAFPSQVMTSGQAYYQLSVPSATASSFTATATPINAQASDSCGAYSINSLGVQSNSIAGTAGCW